MAADLKVAIEEISHGSDKKRNPILWCCTVAKLINQQQRSLGRVVQHRRYVGKILGKGTLRDVDGVDVCDGCKNTVGQRNCRVVCRHERPDVCQQRYHSNLFNVDRLPRIVGTCQDLDQACLHMALCVVWDERFHAHLL